MACLTNASSLPAAGPGVAGATAAHRKDATIPSNTLTGTDNRTGKAYELAITNGAIRAMGLRHIRTGITNTASTLSRTTELDGNRRIVRHRGYPTEEPAKRSSYLAVAYLTGQLVAVHAGRESPCGR